MFLTLLQWIQNTAFFSSLRASGYVYPAVLTLHLSAIALSGGMVVSTFLNIVFIPVLYVVIETIRERVGGVSHRTATS